MIVKNYDQRMLLLTEDDFVAMAEYVGADPVRARGVFDLVYKVTPETESSE